jgi:hypothetical protein
VKPAFGLVSIILAFLAVVVFPPNIYSQEKNLQFTLRSAKDSIIIFPNDFIIPKSIHLTIDNTIGLEEGRDYHIDFEIHFITLSLSLRNTFFSMPSGELKSAPTHTLEMRYSVLPLNLYRTYSRYQIRIDSTSIPISKRKDTVINLQSSISHEKELNLTKSGGITRGIQAGSTEDLSFTNSFNLTFSGNLGDELSFKGALSEESTPLQPEGNTQILRDIDRIYIELTAGKIFQATLGDYTLTLKPRIKYFISEDYELDPIFNTFSRKVLGAKADLAVGPTQIIASASAAKGKFSTFVFDGIDAVQGPYRLQGKNGERDIIIIAGTEHVYIDGLALTRGELNDYVIDYGLAEIKFTNKRIITSASRITIDFEYTDEKYSRSLIAASQTSNFFDNKVELMTSYIREADDQNSPRTLSLSDSDKTILLNAGSDQSKASKSGIIFVGRDSNGRAKGNYVKADTIISGIPMIFYRYAPYDTMNAIYNIGFGFTGTGKGSYSRKGIGEFTFVGQGLGDYDTVLFLPFPELKQLFTSQLTIRPMATLVMTGEFALSDLQPNQFAPMNSVTDKAYRLYGSYFDTLGRLNLAAHYTERFKGENYSPIDRDRRPEELRAYGLDAPIADYSFALRSERERKASIVVGTSQLILEGQYGMYSRGNEDYHANRLGLHVFLREDTSYLPTVTAAASHIFTSDSSVKMNSNWISYFASISKSLAMRSILLTPGLAFTSERKESKLFSLVDSLTSQSFKYDQWKPFLDLKLSDRIKLAASIEIRSDDSSRNRNFTRISNGQLYQLSSSFVNISGLSSQIDIGYRKKEYSDSLAKFLNGGDISSVLLRIIPRYQSPNNIIIVDGIYEVSEQRAARLERIFFPVQKGLGNYKYLGDLNGNGKQDPEEFAFARYSDEGAYILLSIPTETLYPVTDLHSSLRIRFNPFPFLSTETSVRIEENSSDPISSDIYLFKFSHFLNDSLTLRGLIETQQDINILDNDPLQSYRLRFLERKNATQYNTGLEQSYYREFSLRGKFRPSYEISNETNIIHTLDRAHTDEHSTDRPHSTERIDIKTDWTYEPFASAIGIGLKADYSVANDVYFSPIVKSRLNSISGNIRYSVSSAIRLRAELGREELVIRNAVNIFSLPYSVTQGRTIGNTWLWSLSLDMQIASGIVLTAGYNGRSELSNGIDRVIIHNARAEARASF